MAIPEQTRWQLEQRLNRHRRDRWPALRERAGAGRHPRQQGRYEESILPTGSFTGTPEEALDCACGLYLNDPTAWTDHHSRENF